MTKITARYPIAEYVHVKNIWILILKMHIIEMMLNSKKAEPSIILISIQEMIIFLK